MELLCLEKVAAEPFAIDDDPMFTSDERVLQNLYFLEKQYQPKFAYFKCVQTEITPDMRKIIAEWLLEVCSFEQPSKGTGSLDSRFGLLARMSVSPFGNPRPIRNL